MSQNLLQTIGIAAIVGAVSSVATVAVISPSDSHQLVDDASSAHADVHASSSQEELLKQIDQLAIRNQQLTERLQKLESATTDSGRREVGEWATKDELAALRKELGGSGSVPGAAMADPQFEDQVAVALDSIREKERQDWVEKEQAKKAARLDERVDGMREWLSLDDSQASQIRTLIAAKDQRSEDLIKMWKDGADKDMLGQIKKADEETWRNDVRQVLNADQLAKFEKSFSDKRPRNVRSK